MIAQLLHVLHFYSTFFYGRAQRCEKLFLQLSRDFRVHLSLETCLPTKFHSKHSWSRLLSQHYRSRDLPTLFFSPAPNDQLFTLFSSSIFAKWEINSICNFSLCRCGKFFFFAFLARRTSSRFGTMIGALHPRERKGRPINPLIACPNYRGQSLARNSR